MASRSIARCSKTCWCAALLRDICVSSWHLRGCCFSMAPELPKGWCICLCFSRCVSAALRQPGLFAQGIFIEVGMGSMDTYDADFEAYLLAESAAYYQRKAAAWIQVPAACNPGRPAAAWPRCGRPTQRRCGAQEDSCPDYMLKAEECLRAEEERVAHYLHASTKVKLLRAVETELLAKYETRLLEKEHSGAAALLRDDKARRPLTQRRSCCQHRPPHVASQHCKRSHELLLSCVHVPQCLGMHAHALPATHGVSARLRWLH